MMTLYHQLLALVAPDSAEQVEAARCELEDRAAVLRNGEAAATSPVAPIADAGTKLAVSALFDASIAAVGLISSCVEARRAVSQLIAALEART